MVDFAAFLWFIFKSAFADWAAWIWDWVIVFLILDAIGAAGQSILYERITARWPSLKEKWGGLMGNTPVWIVRVGLSTLAIMGITFLGCLVFYTPFRIYTDQKREIEALKDKYESNGDPSLLTLVKISDTLNRAVKTDDENRVINQVIFPLQQTVDVVQADYMTKFQEYRDLLRNKAIPITVNHPIFDRLISDSVCHVVERTKLEGFVTPPDNAPLQFALRMYLSTVIGAVSESDKDFQEYAGFRQFILGHPNLPRTILYQELKRICATSDNDDKKRSDAIGVLDTIATDLRDTYRDLEPRIQKYLQESAYK